MIYSGFIDCGGEEASYEFQSDEILDAMGQLEYLMFSGILQIIDNEPQVEGY
jgi:hypothetical protein